jgi:hypothetical protein
MPGVAIDLRTAETDRGPIEYDLYGDDGLGGIFFDEVQNVCGPGGLYADTYRAIDDDTKRLHRVDGEHVPFTVINPGIDTESCYADIGDVILTIEETYEAYVAWTPPAWHRTVDPRRLWHLVHTTPTEADMVHAMALAKERNAGYVYVTPDVLANPWDTLPDDTRVLRLTGFGDRWAHVALDAQ